MRASRNNPIQIGFRVFLTVSAILLFGAFRSQAEAGVLRLAVKDVNTHYGLQADVVLEGPKKVAVRMNDAGRARLTLVPGEYRIEVSEPLHKTAQTHCKVRKGANLPFTVFLVPEKFPDEELPENIDSKVRAGFTLLHGYTVDSDTGKPVSGVKVRMSHANVETLTDSVGHYFLSVPTPAAKYPGGMGTDTLIFEKRGYSTEVFTNFGLAGDEMGGEGNEMEKGSQVHKHDATHRLMQPGKRPTRERPQSAK
jgi:hypothetical protein